MGMDKRTFIENAKRENETYKAIIEAINTLAPIAKKFNGKVINKRFVDAVNKAFEEKGYKLPYQYYPLRISLDEYNRIYFIACYPCNIAIYPKEYDKPYIIEKRMDYSVFESAIEKTLKNAAEEIANNERCINSIDEVIQGYKELKKHVNDFMESLPYKFRTFQSIDCPVY